MDAWIFQRIALAILMDTKMFLTDTSFCFIGYKKVMNSWESNSNGLTVRINASPNA